MPCVHVILDLTLNRQLELLYSYSTPLVTVLITITSYYIHNDVTNNDRGGGAGPAPPVLYTVVLVLVYYVSRPEDLRLT